MNLPENYKKQMIGLLENDYVNYESCLDNSMNHGIRINTLKISVDEFLKINPFHLEPIPWCENGFYYDDKIDKPSKHPYYFAGLYYIQEPSAMTPASMLPISEGDVVLDICAAPGGKSTELAAKLNSTGLLISNDISASRAKALLKNLELFGVTNSIITTEPPNKLSNKFPSYFDKILIDAPCSGEGMFRKSSSMITAWENNGNDLFAGLQRGILQEIVKMLKPGGMILYSTCTFAPLENEKSIEFLLSLDESLSLVNMPTYDGFDNGHPEWSDSNNQDLRKCIRLWPHRIKGEGHFIALLKKDGDTINEEVRYNNKKVKLTDECVSFLNNISWDFDYSRFEIQKDRLYYLPSVSPSTNGLRILRTGLFVGEFKKNRFEPSQSLAMALKSNEFSNVTDLNIDDERLIKYLKGETIDIDGINGWTLVTVDNYPLGWGKLTNGTLKNKYLPGWRLM